MENDEIINESMENIGDPVILQEQIDTLKPSEEPIRIETMSEFKELLERHPYFEERENFNEQMQYVEAYCMLNENKDKETIIQEILSKYDISEGTIENWNQSNSTPALIRSLVTHENARCKYEAQFFEEAKLHQLDSSQIYNIFKPLKETGNLSPPQLSSTIEVLISISENGNRVLVADLKPYHERGPQWLKGIADSIKENQLEIEVLLGKSPLLNSNSETFRICIDHRILYIWRCDRDETKWINFCADENFYFHSAKAKRMVIAEACQHLGIDGHVRLSRIISQISDHPGKLSYNKPLSDLQYSRLHLKGETLHFLLDVTGQRLQDIRHNIFYVGRGNFEKGRIVSPTFQSFEVIRVRLFASMICDGHLDKNRLLSYCEKNDVRREIVLRHLGRFGSIDYRRVEHNYNFYLYFPAIIGRFMEKWEFPIGDKALQDVSLPDYIMNGSLEVKRAYFQELIPEDGNFYITDGNRGRFQWNRTVVLSAGKKTEKYDFKSKISHEEIEFIKRHGQQKNLTFSQPDFPTSVIKSRWGALEQLANSKDSKITRLAKRLKSTIKKNPSTLLEDELRLCESLGVTINHYPVFITYFPQSERVSVSWQAQTASKEDAVLLGLLAPPNDVEKNIALKIWMSTEGDIFKKVAEELRREKIDFLNTP
ncbi:MAG: hypothetical protein ACFFCH_02935 [Promethearchaeota archaeon]